MIIDQLFENKKTLNEHDGEDCDLCNGTGEGLYDGESCPKCHGTGVLPHQHSDDDFVEPDDYDDNDFEEPESHYEKYVRTRNLEESRRYVLEESRIVESATYKQFYRVGRMLSERKMTDQEIQNLFGQIEADMTNKDTGANRTALGRGKDVVGRAYTNTKDAINNVLSSIQNSAPVAGVDVAYDKATDALANVPGANKVMDSIKKYRLLAKEYPKTQLFVKTALIALAGLATGGAALPAIAGVTAAVDAAIKGEKLSSIIGKGAGAALMGLGAQKLNALLSGGAPANVGNAGAHDMDMMSNMGDVDAMGNPIAGDNTQFTNTYGDNGYGGPEAAADTATQTGEVPTDDSLSPGEEVVPQDATTTGGGEGLPGQFAGGQYDVVKGDTLGHIAQANGVSVEDIKGLNPQINWAKPLQPGMTLNLPPSGDGTGSVWQGYTGGVYGDKAAAAANTASNTGPATGDTATNAASNATTGATRSMAGPNDAAGADQFYNPEASGTAGMSPEDIAADLDYTNRVNAPAPAGYQKGIAYDEEGNLLPGWNAQNIGGKPYKVFKESINFKVIPAEQLIDQKLTVLNWALLESVNRKGKSVSLTTKGVYTVFENVDRYRKAIVEYTQPGREQLPDYYRPDMPGAPQPQSDQPGMIGKGLNWLDKAAKKVGGVVSNIGHQFTTGVTKEKLKMNWHQAGKPTDSDQIAAFLAKQKVPQQVITDVFGKMGIPYAAPAAASTGTQAAPAGKAKAQQPWAVAATNPATGKQWTPSELAGKTSSELAKKFATANAGQEIAQVTGTPSTDAIAAAAQSLPTSAQVPTTPAAKTMTPTTAAGQPYNVTYGKGFNFNKPAAKPAAPNFAKTGFTGYKAATPAPKMPGAPTAPGAPKAPTVTAGGPTAAERQALDKRIAAAAAAQPVAETVKQVKRMMETVTTKADVQRVKDYIDYHMGSNLTERARLKRNRLISEVTQLAATRRREIARRLAQ